MNTREIEHLVWRIRYDTVYIYILSTFVLIIFVVVIVVAINNYNNQLQNCKVWKDALTNPENAPLSKSDRQIGL